MDDIYCVRCVRCLLSVTGSEPRLIAHAFGQHRCDPVDERSLAAFHARATWLDHKGDNE